ncbi:hypothetical protein F2Q70_00019052 [Brassica cretica]|uniref:Protein kinase domain-containing protein n=1 Tax=Brassica cretica TaxID=69181 RepID=A0A8S9I4K0_BRACR|nr:hypothetical protein F2Q70_00019052 [Brassica cretica]
MTLMKRQDSQTTASKSRASRVLPYKTKHLKDDYFLGRVLGQGQFGTTFLCSHNENSLVEQGFVYIQCHISIILNEPLCISFFFFSGLVYDCVVGHCFDEPLLKELVVTYYVTITAVTVTYGALELCGSAPFDAGTDRAIFREILQGKLDFETDPWPSISESAKDLTTKMLVSDPKKKANCSSSLV